MKDAKTKQLLVYWLQISAKKTMSEGVIGNEELKYLQKY